MAFLIKRCFDSHVHWAELGEVKSYLNLSDLKSIQGLPRFNSVAASAYRGDWILGFGWDEHRWEKSDLAYFNRNFLDELYPHNPVAFIRADGHAIWVNTRALQQAGMFTSNLQIPGGKVHLDDQGMPTGILIDRAKEQLQSFIPKATELNVKDYLQLGQQQFVSNGYTHIRDMAFDLVKWKLARELESNGDLSLYVDANFSFSGQEDFDSALQAYQLCQKDKSRFLRPVGLKFYLDGALGSEGALISKNYPNSQSCGLQLFDLNQVYDFILRAWEKNVPIAIHGIGDKAAQIIAEAAFRVKETLGYSGILNLEHGELISSATIMRLAQLNCRVHMQPSHFISDQRFLKEKLGNLYSQVFPWAELEAHAIPISFGSDAPIEAPCLQNTVEGLRLAALNGTRLPQQPWWSYHQHPDENWGGDCFTEVSHDFQIIRHFR